LNELVNDLDKVKLLQDQIEKVAEDHQKFF